MMTMIITMMKILIITINIILAIIMMKIIIRGKKKRIKE